MKFFIAVFAIISSLTLGQVSKAAQNNELKKVLVYHIESLSTKDTTYSARFKKDYLETIKTVEALTKNSIAKCGYKVNTKTLFYDASDPLQAKESAEKAKSDNAWLIVGPARSNHYLLTVKGASDIPSISPLASAEEISSLGNLHTSLSPTNSQMAKAAALEASHRLKGIAGENTYASIVSQDCMACTDFAKHFKSAAKSLGLKLIDEHPVTGRFPDLTKISQSLKKKKPSFILVPNYSKTSAHIIGTVGDLSISSFFVGGDGWGDAIFGFIQNGNVLKTVTGFTVRGYPPTEMGMGQFGFGRTVKEAIQKNPSLHTPASSSALAQLRIAEGLKKLLCKHKPSTQKEFSRFFSGSANHGFRSPWGVSIYDLKLGSLKYTSSVRL